MGTRKRIIRVRVGEFATTIKLRQKRNEVIDAISRIEGCSWAEAKKIQKFEQVEKSIKREMSLRTTEEFNGDIGGVWLSGEDSAEMKDGLDMFDYYTENYNRYELGVHNIIYKWLEKKGWYAEWYDAGTIMLYKI